MKLHTSLSTLCFLNAILLGSMAAGVCAEEPTTIKLTLHPQAIEDHGPSRPLLPEAPDLKPGNAAVVLLRMPWGETGFMTNEYRNLFDNPPLALDDPRLTDFPFDRFAAQMRRAAFMKDADWDYPIDDEPLDGILLPDASGLRVFVGTGMSVWVTQQIAKGNLNGAREGVLVQLTCARHLGQTRFIVIQMIAAVIADQAFDGLERVIGAPGSPNLHRAIALLPDSLGRSIEALQWEAVIEERSMPMLRTGIPEAGDDAAWTRVLDGWLDRWMSYEGTPTPEKSAAIRARIATAGREAFATVAPADLDLETASDDEIAMRFLLVTFRQIHQTAESAWRLEGPEAIAALVELDARGNRLQPTMGEGLLSYLANPLKWYLPIHSFGRRARMLEVVEALRDAAARNGGRFPSTLAAVPAHVPLDPFTRQPFLYVPSEDGRSARLATPPIPGVDDPRYVRVYELTLPNE